MISPSFYRPRLIQVWWRFCFMIGCALVFSLSGCKVNNDDLIRAAEKGDEAALGSLLHKGADVNATDRNGYGALYFASFRGHKAIVETLIQKGANVNARGNMDYTPLHAAAMGGHREIAELLVEMGAEVNAVSKHGITPLGEAANTEVADFLIAHGGRRR